MKKIVVSIGVLFVAACSHRPIEELALADVALKAAQKAKADIMAPDQYRKAENYYLRAKRDYNDGYYDASRKFAADARIAAEQAEFRAVLKQSQSGKGRPEESSPLSPPSSSGPSGPDTNIPPPPMSGPGP